MSPYYLTLNRNITSLHPEQNNMQSTDRFGLSVLWPCPSKMTSPLTTAGSPPRAAPWCLDAGCSSLTVFGTTGEGASVSLTERGEVLGALLSAGVEPGRQLVGGVSAASIGDAVEQIRTYNHAGCQRILLAPPFYFKGVSDEGLYHWFARVGEKVAHRPRASSFTTSHQ